MNKTRRMRLVLWGLVALLTLSIGSWGLDQWKPFALAWPSKWDPRLAPLADYISRHNDQPFEHPVRARFLGDKEFNKLVTDDEKDLTSPDKAYYKDLGDLLRTLGLANGDVKVFNDLNTLSTGNILAYYSPKDREMVIRSDEATVSGGKLSPALKAVVVHELTHALQDQQFGLGRIQKKAEKTNSHEALTALIEGHANNIESRYVEDNYDDAELEEYQKGTQGSSTSETKAVPEVLSAQQFSPYALGPTFVAELQRKGGDALTSAFSRHQPASLEQIILPSKYFKNDKVEKLAAPKRPPGSTTVLSGQLSQLDLYFILASSLGAPEALRISDLWGNAMYTAYRSDSGKKLMCVDINIVGDNADGTAKLEKAFTKWSKSPSLLRASVTKHKDHFMASVCDSGKLTKHKLPTPDDTSQFFGRANDIAYLWRGGDETDAECVASGIYTEFNLNEIESNDAVIARYNELITTCATK